MLERSGVISSTVMKIAVGSYWEVKDHGFNPIPEPKKKHKLTKNNRAVDVPPINARLLILKPRRQGYVRFSQCDPPDYELRKFSVPEKHFLECCQEYVTGQHDARKAR